MKFPNFRFKLFFVIILASLSAKVSAQETPQQLQTYLFSPKSKIGFKARATVLDFKGESTALTGRFELDLSNLDQPGRGALEVRADSLNTKHKKRDRVMRQKHLETEKYPLIRFVIKEAKLETDDPDQKKADYVLQGELDIHGVRKPIQVVATLDYKRDDKLKINGSIPIKMTDFEIRIPTFAVVLRVKNEVNVYFDLIATPINNQFKVIDMD